VDFWVLACLKNQDKTILNINWLAAWLTAAEFTESEKKMIFDLFKKN
jgi:hypothetical protein